SNANWLLASAIAAASPATAGGSWREAKTSGSAGSIGAEQAQRRARLREVKRMPAGQQDARQRAPAARARFALAIRGTSATRRSWFAPASGRGYCDCATPAVAPGQRWRPSDERRTGLKASPARGEIGVAEARGDGGRDPGDQRG